MRSITFPRMDLRASAETQVRSLLPQSRSRIVIRVSRPRYFWVTDPDSTPSTSRDSTRSSNRRSSIMSMERHRDFLLRGALPDRLELLIQPLQEGGVLVGPLDEGARPSQNPFVGGLLP